MITRQMLFHRGTVLEDRAVDPGQQAPVPEHLVRAFLSAGRASLVPGEAELAPPTSITPASMGLAPEAPAPKKGGRR